MTRLAVPTTEDSMLTGDALWLVEEPVLDEPADLLTVPEIRQYVAPEPHDDELGLRTLLEIPEAPPSRWWPQERRRDRRLARCSRRRRATDLGTVP
jgi:hypothetical protein